MKTSVIVIGDELLIGQVIDTNSGFIARHMAPYGWEVSNVQVVSDDTESIRQAINRAFEQTSVVLTTGGLGPTKDDITKTVLRDYFGGEMQMRQDVLDNVKEIFRRRGIKLNPLTEAQAIVPSSADVIQNRVGTAPIMWFEQEGRVLVAMPGVPFETQEMFVSEVFPRLRATFDTDTFVAHRTVITEGISESALAMRLETWETALPPHLHMAYLPKSGMIRLRLDGHHSNAEFIESEIESYTAQLIELCGENFLYAGDKTPAEILLEKLIQKNLTVATAESCTGGNIAHLITSIPGSSQAMLGGIVSYSNHLKRQMLNVDADTLVTHGAVSIPVVEQMALGACHATSADIALATSGIAGPGGGTEEKPVGTVCIAVAKSDGTVISGTYRFPGERERVIDRASQTALILAIRLISE